MDDAGGVGAEAKETIGVVDACSDDFLCDGSTSLLSLFTDISSKIKRQICSRQHLSLLTMTFHKLSLRIC